MPDFKIYPISICTFLNYYFYLTCYVQVPNCKLLTDGVAKTYSIIKQHSSEAVLCSDDLAHPCCIAAGCSPKKNF